METKRITRGAVKKIITELFSEKPVYIAKLNNGNTNKVYKVILKDAYLIVRLSNSQDRINYFLKEQWCTHHVSKKGVPAPEILEVGNTIVPFPYMVVREMNGIPGNLYEGDRTNMIEQLGKFASIINNIPTKGHGEIFNWSSNVLTKNESWLQFLEKNLHIDHILAFHENAKLLSEKNIKKFKTAINKIKKLEMKTTLAHGDLLPKNVIVNREGNIISVIDWESAQSQYAKYWELATSLNNIEEKEREIFLKGYGMKKSDYEDIAREIDALWIVKKSDLLEQYYKKSEKEFLKPLMEKINQVMEKY